MEHIAFVGTGAMGSRMARRLLAAGHDVNVWNRTASRAQDLAAAGAHVAATPREAARGARYAITMVADETALAAVTEGPDGILAALEPNSTLLEMSTSGPAAIARLAAAVPAGAHLVDAPVLGSLSEVDAGTLSIFVGGTGDDFARVEGLLAALGTPLHVGPLGAGARAKLVANASLVGVLGLLGELLALADGLGLPRSTAFSVLSRTPLAAQAERRRPAVEGPDGDVRFRLALALKDAELVTRSAESAGVDVRLLPAAASWLRQAVASGRGEADYSAVLREIIAQGRGDGV